MLKVVVVAADVANVVVVERVVVLLVLKYVVQEVVLDVLCPVWKVVVLDVDWVYVVSNVVETIHQCLRVIHVFSNTYTKEAVRIVFIRGCIIRDTCRFKRV